MKQLLMTPGTVSVPMEIKKKLFEDVIYHKMTDCKKLFSEVNENFKQFFKTKQDVLTMTCSDTEVVEAATINLFSKNEKVLVINTGNFGQKFIKNANANELDVIELKYESGSTYDLGEVKKIISENPDLKGIFMSHSEAMTGTANDIQNIGALTKDTDILLLVDSVSGMVINKIHWTMTVGLLTVSLLEIKKGFYSLLI